MPDKKYSILNSRGVIIIDTSSLLRLCKKTRLSGKTADSFLEPLGYLAEHGFTVIIPEFVLAEATNKCPSEHLEEAINRVRSWPLDYAGERKVLREFINKYADHLMLLPAKPTDRSGNELPYMEALRLIREADKITHPEYENSLPAGDGNIDQARYRAEQANTKIIKAKKISEDMRDMGELNCFRVMLDVLFAQVPMKNKVPVFMLSDDFHYNKELITLFFEPAVRDYSSANGYKELPDVSFLSTAGLLRALGEQKNKEETSILKRSGIIEKADAALHIICNGDQVEVDKAWNGGMRDKAVLTPRAISEVRFPFQSAMRDFRKELEQSEPPADLQVKSFGTRRNSTKRE